MRHCAILLMLAVFLAACNGIAIGPVNHACVGSPMRSQGSGCDDRHGD
jgi:hypothetical protein